MVVGAGSQQQPGRVTTLTCPPHHPTRSSHNPNLPASPPNLVTSQAQFSRVGATAGVLGANCLALAVGERGGRVRDVTSGHLSGKPAPTSETG